MSISIANRILLGFALVIALMVGLGFYAVQQIGVVRDAADTIVTRDMTVMRQLDRVRDLESQVGDLRYGVVTAYLLRTVTQQGEARDDLIARWRQAITGLETLIADTRSALGRYRASAVSPDRIEAWRRIEASFGELGGSARQFRELAEREFAAAARNDTAALQAAEVAFATVHDAFNGHMEMARSNIDTGITAGQRRATEIYEESKVSVIAALAGAALLAILLSVMIRGSIVRPLEAFMAFVERVGRGELAGQPAATGGDELGRLGVQLNAMVEGLRHLAQQSREATANLNASAAEIRASTQEQAASVEEQLAAVQETAATVDEITHSGAQIGKRAQEVIVAAQATAQSSAAGLRAVQDTVQAMDAIREQAETVAENIVALSEKTQAIGEIISSVNDISERTHLLALNAAIEAAAAGESGRSFGVVASEMKMLADQAKEGTNQVRLILGDIQRGINSSVMLTEEAVKRAAVGKERTDQTQRTIDEITARVQEGVQTFQQIVASTSQQQLGIEQVMGALQNIRQASQQTAAGTRQLDTAAGNLGALAQQLLGLVERYRL